MTELRLAIWDVDGTLVDSRDVIQACMETAFRGAGLPPPEYDATRRIVGLSLGEALGTLAPPDIGADQLAALVEAYKQSFVTHRTAPGYHEPLYDGAIELLDQLKADGWLMAVATGKSHRGVDALFEKHNLRSYFDTVWCADDGPGKPHPFMVEQAMGALGCAPQESLMIGDAIHDMAMGKAAGVRALGVSWGFGRADELASAGADEIHHDFRTLTQSLKAFAEIRPVKAPGVNEATG
ncbi:HAD hydrolase, IA family [Hyphomonas neptunium ATCC 15444]|uniref:HAD hydrolase, IA family n=2 Tax=Hyphomonas TaxID=85 RepID=Q0C3G7_HYPNA|nr:MULTISPECIES: HAD-IA family hydrolase [Hyphomonas]ABI78202.1 HAD hydrolase, IA family [Hyphomonas neptunium ATCC 15444]KCZ96065.1 HAD family hydrolase [Hyphomonas hirschiana VP5]